MKIAAITPRYPPYVGGTDTLVRAVGEQRTNPPDITREYRCLEV